MGETITLTDQKVNIRGAVRRKISNTLTKEPKHHICCSLGLGSSLWVKSRTIYDTGYLAVEQFAIQVASKTFLTSKSQVIFYPSSSVGEIFILKYYYTDTSTFALKLYLNQYYWQYLKSVSMFLGLLVNQRQPYT